MYLQPRLLLLFILTVFQTHAQNFDTFDKHDGLGLYFSKTFSKTADLKLVSKIELPGGFDYPDFYFNETKNKLYLYNRFQMVPVEKFGTDYKFIPANYSEEVTPSPIGTPPPKKKPGTEHIEIIRDRENVVFRMPTHHMGSEMIMLNVDKKNFKTRSFVDSLNALGIEKMREFKLKGRGSYLQYDRIFINTEDTENRLIIWLKDHQVFANFMNSKGEWQFKNPKIIHDEIPCNNDLTNKTRNIANVAENTTIINELSSIKVGDKYYITYSMGIGENSKCFLNYPKTIHSLILTSNLEIENTTRLPYSLERQAKGIFSDDTQIKSYFHLGILYVTIQSPALPDKIFVSTYDKNLRLVGTIKYLSNSARTNTKIISSVKLEEGLLITYQNVNVNNKDFYDNEKPAELYSQLISPGGVPSMPVSVLDVTNIAGEKQHIRQYVVKDEGLLNYYLVVRENEKPYLYRYTIPANDLVEQSNYQISEQNWQYDRSIKEIDAMVNELDKLQESKSLKGFKKELRELTKEAFVDEQFQIKKYIRTYHKPNEPGKDEARSSLYYDSRGVERCVIFYVPSDNYKVIHYYNAQGLNFWNVANEKGRIKVSDKFFDRNRNTEGVYFLKPFDDFHTAY